jgi:hypothetical protein
MPRPNRRAYDGSLNPDGLLKRYKRGRGRKGKK